MLRDKLLPALVFGISVVALVAHAAVYYPFFTDDAFISLRYAERLLDGKGLTWTDGDAVEGYTNLLWVLATAGLGQLGMDLVDATRLLGVAGFGAAIGALVERHRPSTLASALPALAGSLGLAAVGAVAVWVVGGLEPPMIAGLLAWAIVRSEPLLEEQQPPLRAVLVPGVLFGLLCLTRPDGVIFVASACVALVSIRRTGDSVRTALLLAAPPVVMIATQLAWRLVTYGAWVPNTAHQRLVFSTRRLAEGWANTWSGLWPAAALVLPALAAVVIAVRVRTVRRRVLFLAAPLVLWTGWTTLIGGDYMPGRRYAVPTFLLLALLAAETWRWAVDGAGRIRVAVAWVVALASLPLLASMQLHRDAEVSRALDEHWPWTGKVVGEMLHRAFADHQPLLAVASAGCLPYFSKLPAVDMLGLNDRYLATHPPANLGDGTIGHELGDGRYVLGREPDLVIFCLPVGRPTPCFVSGRQMLEQSEFAEHYRLLTFVAEGTVPHPIRLLAREHPPKGRGPVRLRVQLYARIDSPRIGIVRQPDRIVAPSYLFTGDSLVAARLDDDGALYIQLGKNPAPLRSVWLPAGAWMTGVDEGAAATLAVTASDTGQFLPPGPTPGSVLVEAPDGVVVDLTLEASHPTRVRQVVLSRVPLG